MNAEQAYDALRHAAEKVADTRHEQHSGRTEAYEALVKVIDEELAPKIDDVYEAIQEDLGAPEDYRGGILEELRREREKQEQKWDIMHDDAHSLEEWVAILVLEMGPIPWGGEVDSRTALVKVAAVAVAAIEAIDRRGPGID